MTSYLCGAFHFCSFSVAGKRPGFRDDKEELSRSPEPLKRNGLHFSWKTFPDCYRMTEAGRCLPSSPRLLNWGMISNSVCITLFLPFESPAAAACILSDILKPMYRRAISSQLRQCGRSQATLSDRKVSVSTIQAEVPALNAPAPVDGAVKQDCTS